jgi:hypothetical protein
MAGKEAVTEHMVEIARRNAAAAGLQNLSQGLDLSSFQTQ